MLLTHKRNYDNFMNNIVLHQIHKYDSNLARNYDVRDGDRGSWSSHGAPGECKQIHVVRVWRQDRAAETALNIIPYFETLE